jgi:hypothetical protein
VARLPTYIPMCPTWPLCHNHCPIQAYAEVEARIKQAGRRPSSLLPCPPIVASQLDRHFRPLTLRFSGEAVAKAPSPQPAWGPTANIRLISPESPFPLNRPLGQATEAIAPPSFFSSLFCCDTRGAGAGEEPLCHLEAPVTPRGFNTSEPALGISYSTGLSKRSQGAFSMS